MKYSTNEELFEIFRSNYYKEHAMYLSVFGYESTDFTPFESTELLRDKSVIDIERGNLPFGGYGIKASHVRHKDRVRSRPILISKEIGIVST